MTQRRDYYRLLHVDPDAPNEIVKASYRTLMQRLRMHPDLGGDHATAALINEAFEVIGDPVQRAAYDAWLRSTEPATEPATEPPGDRHEPRSAETASACAFCLTPHHNVDLYDRDRVCVSCGASIFPAQHHHGDDSSRRAIARVPRFMPVTFLQANSPRGVGRGTTQDISLTGLRMLAPISLPVGASLLVECEFCSAVGAVRSARPHAGGGSFEIGVQFVTMRLKRQRGSLISTLA